MICLIGMLKMMLNCWWMCATWKVEKCYWMERCYVPASAIQPALYQRRPLSPSPMVVLTHILGAFISCLLTCAKCLSLKHLLSLSLSLQIHFETGLHIYMYNWKYIRNYIDNSALKANGKGTKASWARRCKERCVLRENVAWPLECHVLTHISYHSMLLTR